MAEDVTQATFVSAWRRARSGSLPSLPAVAVGEGFAYGATASQAFTITSLPTGPRPGVEVDVRAYRADGRQLEIDGGRPR